MYCSANAVSYVPCGWIVQHCGFYQSCEAVHKLLQLFLQARCVHVTGTTKVSTYFLHQGGRCMTLKRITATTLSSEPPAPAGMAQKMLYSFAVDPCVQSS